MKDGGHDGLGVEVQRRQDACDRNGMGDIGIAGAPGLPLMRGLSEFDRLPDVLDILVFQVGGNLIEERFGVVETWEDEPGEFPQEVLDLIGKDPEIAEEFDVEEPG